MRVMLDTNILVSAIVFRSRTMDGVIEALAAGHSLVLCSHVIDELRDVVRKKFPSKAADTESFLAELPFEYFCTPQPTPKHGLFEIRDPDDEAILYSAIATDVDVFVTGDKDFSDAGLGRPDIVTPIEFLERYR
jgi:putative PIN family toxin of toxin-antitoxin system